MKDILRLNTVSKIIVATVLLLGVFLRIYNLDVTPSGLTNDEVNAAFNSYTIAQTGHDLAGQPWYIAMFITPKYYTMTDLQAVFSAPWIRIFGLSLVSVRSWYALLGILSIFFIYLISKYFTNRQVALISFLLLCISPWHLHFSRLSYDGMLSLFFLTMGLCAVLYLPRDRLLLAVIPFIAAFHSYHAVKIITLPYLLAAIYARWSDQRSRRNLVILGITFLIYLLIYTPIFFKYSAVTNRVSELGVNKPSFIQDIAEQRQHSILPRQLIDISINKYSLISHNILDNFFGFFNPEMLFGSGETMAIYSSWRHGLLYPIEFGFLVFGLIKLSSQKRPQLYLLLAFILISILPSVLNTNVKTYAMRSLNALPFLMIIIASGLYASIELFSQKFWRVSVTVVIVFAYIGMLLNYVIIYHGIYAVSSAQGFLLQDRLLSAYLNKLPSEQKVMVFTNEPRGFLLRHAFYTQADSRSIQDQWYKQSFQLSNITILPDCKDNIADNSLQIIHKDLQTCLSPQDQGTIYTTDANQIWHFSADQLCTSYSLTDRKYLTPQSPEQWRSIETQQTPELCKNWFQLKTPVN